MPYPFRARRARWPAEYLAAGRAALGDKFAPNYSSMEGFVAAKTIVEGLRRAGNAATPETLVSAMESVRELNLGGFYVDFNATEAHRLPLRRADHPDRRRPRAALIGAGRHAPGPEVSRAPRAPCPARPRR